MANPVSPDCGLPTSRMLKWGAGAILAILGGGLSIAATAWAQSLYDHVEKIQVHSERIGRVEAHYSDVDRRLERIEDKLDELLKRRP